MWPQDKMELYKRPPSENSSPAELLTLPFTPLLYSPSSGFPMYLSPVTVCPSPMDPPGLQLPPGPYAVVLVPH